MRLIQLLLVATSLLLASSCGKNNGTPRPNQDNPVPGDLMLAPSEGVILQPSDAKKWRAELRWAQTPRFSDEELLALTGVIFLRRDDGQTPKSAAKVELIADMPQHGHGTGNNLPSVHATEGDVGRLTFDNVIFTMQGSWRIRIKATLDGAEDVWTTWVEVK